MKEIPILFSSPMVRAILDGRKSQTRRVVKSLHLCPYGEKGSILWVRETFVALSKDNILYRADDRYPDSITPLKWKPSIFMPRWASRITLEITGVRVERLQDISEEDALTEGCENYLCGGYDFSYHGYECKPAVANYRRLWDSINGKKYPWKSNPLVWVISFRRI